MPTMDQKTQAGDRQASAESHTSLRRRLLSGGLSAAPVLMAMSSRSALAQTCLTPSRAMSGNMSAAEPAGGCTLGSAPSYWASPANFSNWPVDPPTLQKYTSTSGSYQNRWTAATPSTPPVLSQFNYTPGPTVNVSFRIALVVSALDFGTQFTVFQQRRGLVNVLSNPASNAGTAPAVDPLRGLSLWEVLAYSSAVDGGTGFGELARHCVAAYLNALKFGTSYPVTANQAIGMWLEGTSGGYCALGSCTPAQTWQAADIIAYLSQTWTV